MEASLEQIQAARSLASGMDITSSVGSAEHVPLGTGSFDAVTAVQCFFYFNHDKLPRTLQAGDRLLTTYVTWLPGVDPPAAASEELVLRYNPARSGAGEVFRPVELPVQYQAGSGCLPGHQERWDLPFLCAFRHGRLAGLPGHGCLCILGPGVARGLGGGAPLAARAAKRRRSS